MEQVKDFVIDDELVSSVTNSDSLHKKAKEAKKGFISVVKSKKFKTGLVIGVLIGVGFMKCSRKARDREILRALSSAEIKLDQNIALIATKEALDEIPKHNF